MTIWFIGPPLHSLRALTITITNTSAVNKIILDECSTGDQTIILGLQIFTITNCNCVHLDCRLLSWISLETDIFGTIHCKSGKLADFVLFPEFYLHSFQSFAKKL